MKAERRASDEGFGMAELGIYAALSVVILTILATLFISSLRIREQVTDLTTAAGVGQVIASSVEEGVRNASGPLGAPDTEQQRGIKTEEQTLRGQLMRARVAVGAQDGSIVWQCQAWYFSLDTKSVYSATSDELIEDPVGFSEEGGVHEAEAGDGNWALLGSGVQLAPQTDVFFGADQDNVVLRFEVVADNERLILIPSTVVRRSGAAGGIGPDQCY
jgi:hypothetical protein